MKTPVDIAVVGATGAVGREMLTVLEERRFPCGRVRALASASSAGSTVRFRGELVRVEELREGSLAGVDIALFSAGGGVSKRFGPGAAAGGCLVIDNSSAFRMDEGVGLVVPEVNGEALAGLSQRYKYGERGGIIANPNCSAIILVVGLEGLRRAFGLQRVVVSTYQAASGAGAKGMQELERQTRDVLSGKEAGRGEVFHEPYAFNVFSHNSSVDARTGRNGEEEKIVAETGKIWGTAGVAGGRGAGERGEAGGGGGVRVSPTCVRVPVMRAHAESVNVTLAEPATLAGVRAALEAAAGVRVVDDRDRNLFPTPLKASGKDEVLVGRLRVDLGQLDGDPTRLDLERVETRGFEMLLVGDQLRKGAALNAVQIAELALDW